MKEAFQAVMTRLEKEYPALQRVNDDRLEYPGVFVCEIQLNSEGKWHVYYGILDSGPHVDPTRFWTRKKDLDVENFYSHVKDAIADYRGI